MNLFWTLVIGLPALVGTIGEVYALRSGKLTLSRYLYQHATEFPLVIACVFLFIGGLAVHVLWHWCPAGIGGAGG